jgi:hypothetical protein
VVGDLPPEQNEVSASVEIADAGASPHMDFEPSPVSGMDMRDFRNWLIRAFDGDPAVPPSILLAVRAGSRQADAQDKKTQEWWERFMWQHALDQQLREINRLIAQYNEMADWHHQQAEIARRKMGEAGDKLSAIDDFLSGAKDVLGGRERTGKLDREKAIELLRGRGVAVDPSANNAQLEILLAKEQAAARRERSAWSKQYEQSETKATNEEEMEIECRKKAEELVQKRDEIRNHGYDTREEALRLREASEPYQLDIQMKANDIEKGRAKEISADTIRAEKDSLLQIPAKQTVSEADDFTALAAGALSGEFAKASKGTEIASMMPPPAPPTGSPPSANRSIG